MDSLSQRPDGLVVDAATRPEGHLLSIVTPAYNEELNLPLFYEQVRQTLERADVRWEWIIVDDHSSDGTFDVAAKLAAADPRFRTYRLARNSGSHIAVNCGIAHAGGDCTAVMASDLQDPPETSLPLLDQWRQGGDIVWAVREGREGESRSTVL